MSFGPFTHLTFDCYGTLIDWETGILAVLWPLFERTGAAREEILTLYARFESEEEAGAYRKYREVLAATAARIGEELGAPLTDAERRTLPDSVGNWPPFPDTAQALQRLKSRYKLVILSNIDDSLFEMSRERLDVAFDEVITAEQVRSYKPARAHFNEAIRRLAVPKEQILHVAQSLYHDHVPAKEMGFRTVWINRPSLLPGTGISPQAGIQADLVFEDLAGFAEVACPP